MSFYIPKRVYISCKPMNRSSKFMDRGQKKICLLKHLRLFQEDYPDHQL